MSQRFAGPNLEPRAYPSAGDLLAPFSSDSSLSQQFWLLRAGWAPCLLSLVRLCDGASAGTVAGVGKQRAEPGCCLRSPSGWGPQGPRGGLLPSSELAPPALPFPPLLQPGCGRGRSLGPAEAPGMEMSCVSPAGRCSGTAPRAGGRRDQVHEHPERPGAGSRGVWSVCGDGTTHPGPQAAQQALPGGHPSTVPAGLLSAALCAPRPPSWEGWGS